MMRASHLKTTCVALLLGALSLAGPMEAGARLVNGAFFSPRITTADVPMVLNGAGLKTLWRVYKVSAAALYLGEGVPPSEVLGNVPKRLEIEYFYAISAKDFVTLTQKLIRENVNEGTLASLQSKIEHLNSLYRSVQPGDRYALTYTPAMGTTLSLNGVDIGTIQGEDFAAAVFSMWLGPRPLSESLKAELLGKG